LRHKSDGTKQLEYYDNEKKSLLKDAVPKGVIDLSKVMLIQRMPEPDKKSQFIMNFSEGALYRLFEAPSTYNMEEWVTALNSIIFSKVLGECMLVICIYTLCACVYGMAHIPLIVFGIMMGGMHDTLT